MLTDVSVERIAPNFRPPVVTWFLARLIFDREDRSDTSLRNVGSHTYYALYIPEYGNIHNYRCEDLKLRLNSMV
jgi:hypothetical protein